MVRRLAWACVLVAGVAACTTRLEVDAVNQRPEPLHLDLDQVIAPCDGTITFGDSTATFSLSPDQHTCRAHLVLAGSILTVADIKQAYRDEVDGYPDDTNVFLTGLQARLRDVKLVDPDGVKLLAPVVSRWNAAIALAGTPVVALAGADTGSLFGGMGVMDLGAAAAPVNQAVAADGPLPASGSVDVDMDVASIAVSLAGRTRVALELTVDVTLDLHISKSAWSEL